jgi:subfamily B ATP-binding cassette protein HlyB/CyaB
MTLATNQGVRPGKGAPVFRGGFQALAQVARNHGVHTTAAQIAHEMAQGRTPLDAEDLVRAAKLIGLKARIIRNPSARRLRAIPVPAIVRLKDGAWAIFRGERTPGLYRLADPAAREFENLPLDEVVRRIDGEVLLIGKGLALATETLAFGFGWFIGAIKRYRKPLAEVLVLSFFVNLLALATPLCFQLVIDKVLAHKSFSTLVVVISALVLLAMFSGILKYLRQYLLVHTSNRIDVELGAKLFDHLIHLPVSFFEKRAAGVIVTRARELQSIRNFLTGEALLAAIDLGFIFIFFAVLFLYSKLLALIVLLLMPFYVVVGAILRPKLKRLLKAKFRRWAAGQQLLVESIIGVQTLKASAVEPVFQRHWDDRLSSFVQSNFDAKMVGVAAATVVEFLGKLTLALILFFGTVEVLEGRMTVGGLVAFSMITRRTTQPILRLSQLWQDFQQAQVAIDHVGDILNAEVESRPKTALIGPQLQGEIEFRNVGFRYREDLPEVLKNISLRIHPGEMIGIVGPSGSGKSTLTKLLQRLHMASSGEILIDGMDVAQLDPAWLRRQLGVVLQENFLFNQTVHENIALARPDMPRAQVIRVARLAGADEFICDLPLGYDTVIEERGANLSGGQRQRLAIARALATDPRILIFDEATSSLDYDSERIIQQNMDRIAQDRTVIIIAHRLAAVRHCDRLIGIVNGEIVETGTHEELLRRRGGLYAHLWALQNEHLNA